MKFTRGGTAPSATALGVLLIAFATRMPVTSIPPVLNQLGLGKAAETALVTIPVVCFGLGALAGPPLRARFGDSRTVLALVSLLLVAVALRAIRPEWALFPGTIVAALAIAVLNVLLPSVIKRHFPDRLGLAMTAYVVALSLGSGLAAGLTVPLQRAFGGAVAAALGMWTLPIAVSVIAWLPQLRWRETTAPSDGDAAPRSIWTRRLAWHVLFFTGVPGALVFYGPLSWLPQIYEDRGLDAAEAGFLLMVMSMASFLGNLGAPVLASHRRGQRPAVTATVVLAIVGLVGIWLAPLSTTLVWVIILGIAQGAGLSLSLLMITLRSGDAEMAVRLSSMSQCGGYLIGAVGPFVMGLLHIATGGWAAPLLFVIAAAAASLPSGLAASRDVVIGQSPLPDRGTEGCQP